MKITLNNPVVPPAPSWTNIHLDSLVITVKPNQNEKMSLQARIRLSYIDESTGDKTFSADTQEIHIHDVDKWADDMLTGGDNEGDKARTNIFKLIGLLVKAETPWGGNSVA